MDWDWVALGVALRDRRLVLRLTQEELADLAEIHAGTVKNYEAGKRGYDKIPKGALQLEKALGWAPGSVLAVLEGGQPTIVIPRTGEYPPAQDPYQPLSERLPVQIIDELSTGEVYAAEIHDLTVDGGMRIITVAVRHPSEAPGQQISPQQRRRDHRAWSRAQRRLKGLPPLEWEPGDPEEWRADEAE